jgi:hypothetical protein
MPYTTAVPLTARQKLLVHQVHPIKLSADIGASLLSLALIWCGHRRGGMVIHLALPVLGSAAVLAAADLPRLASTSACRYVRHHMPPAAQALRLVGDALTVAGARRHRVDLIAAGLLVVVAGWSHGLLPTAVREPSQPTPDPERGVARGVGYHLSWRYTVHRSRPGLGRTP